MKHLILGDIVWCGGSAMAPGGDLDDDPRLATCHACLTNAATYGAAAAMRAAAVEFADGTEATKERDRAYVELSAMREALATHDLFHCSRCRSVMSTGFKGKAVWCKACEAEAS